jgi:superfamily I DNA/RNA helicase
VIDYNDMIYLPALQLGKGWSGFRHQWIFVDEAQDLSKAQRIILQNLLAKGGRLVAVGDEKQAIYGFRGADADSMRLLKEHFACKELPLSICYRCPKSHVDLAKELVPQIEAAKTAKEGTVTGMKYDMLPTIAQEGDLVMCRRNAPLVKAALTVIASGKKAKVKGRDIGKGLSKLVQKMNCSYTDELLVKLNAYVDREVMRLRQADKESQAESLCDRRDCIEIIAEGTQTSRELTEKVERIFADKADGVIFSSVHRAKGLEAERAFVLEYDTLPFTWRKQREWQYQQELNIKYVALTRSKSALFLVDKEESK